MNSIYDYTLDELKEQLKPSFRAKQVYNWIYKKYASSYDEMKNIPNDLKEDSLKELIKNKDVFIGVSAKGIVTKDMIKSMNNDPFVFAMANPDPEISPEDAIGAGAYIVGTGRSDYPNQINNVLAFPGIFRGALDSRAKKITDSMKLSAAKAIAYIIEDSELSKDYIIPSPFDKRVSKAVSEEIKKEVNSK